MSAQHEHERCNGRHTREEEEAHLDHSAAEEQFHFRRVVGSFTGYERVARADAQRTENAARQLPPRLAALLPPRALEARVARLRAAAAANGEFLRAVVDNKGAFGAPGDGGAAESGADDARAVPREADFGKVRSTLHSCVRDWGEEGARERAQCYGPLLEELSRVFPECVNPATGKRRRVLVPGAGLGRLVLEVASRGYGAQGNEFSYHMLLVSNYILNARNAVGSWKLYPWVDQPSNVKDAADRTRCARIPDVVPASLLEAVAGGPAPDFSMAAGEFLEVYRDQKSEWDCVLSCFFVDTAPVVLEYVDAIYDMLKPGGVFVNLGPLLYHWVPAAGADLADDDERYGQSLEFSWDELRAAMVARGFEIEREGWRSCTYTANARSMMKTDYECIFFTARKPL